MRQMFDELARRECDAFRVIAEDRQRFVLRLDQLHGETVAVVAPVSQCRLCPFAYVRDEKSQHDQRADIGKMLGRRNRPFQAEGRSPKVGCRDFQQGRHLAE